MGAELFTCPYPPKVQARPPRDQRLAPPSKVSGQGFFSVTSKGSSIYPHHPTDSRGELAGTSKPSAGSPRDDPSHHEWALYHGATSRSYSDLRPFKQNEQNTTKNNTCSILSRTEEPAKVGTCARDRRALQQLALNVHVKHSDLT